MAVSKPFLEDVVGKLGLIVPIRAKAMFGGYGLYGGDKFFAVIDDDRLYFKVGQGNVADFEALQCAWFDPHEHWQAHVVPRTAQGPVGETRRTRGLGGQKPWRGIATEKAKKVADLARKMHLLSFDEA